MHRPKKCFFGNHAWWRDAGRNVTVMGWDTWLEKGRVLVQFTTLPKAPCPLSATRFVGVILTSLAAKCRLNAYQNARAPHCIGFYSTTLKNHTASVEVRRVQCRTVEPVKLKNQQSETEIIFYYSAGWETHGSKKLRWFRYAAILSHPSRGKLNAIESRRMGWDAG